MMIKMNTMIKYPPHSPQREEVWQTPHSPQRRRSRNCVQHLPRWRGLKGGFSPSFGGGWGKVKITRQLQNGTHRLQIGASGKTINN